MCVCERERELIYRQRNELATATMMAYHLFCNVCLHSLRYFASPMTQLFFYALEIEMFPSRDESRTETFLSVD